VAGDVVWVDDLAGYRRVAEGPAGTVVPILRPPDREREHRWRAVIEWYRRRLGPAVDHVPEAPRGRVIAVGAGFAAAAAFHAAASGRRFERVRTLDAARRRLAADPPDPADPGDTVTIVAPPAVLRRPAVRPLTVLGPPAWGVLTAADVPGMTFLVAKQLLARRLVGGPYGVIDGLNGEWYEFAEDGRAGPPGPLDAQVAIGKLQESDWHALGMAAHGEAGHLNLGAVVLCGLLGDVERAPDGRVLDGCRVGAGGRHCKRAAGARATALSFATVRAAHIALFSCSSSSVAPEPYPSSISGVLSAVDGYASSVLTTDRLVRVDDRDAHIALAVLRAAGPGALADCMNDVQQRRMAARPYVLFGDPWRLPLPAAAAPNRVPLGPAAPAVVRVAVPGRPALIDTEPRPAGLALVAGSGAAYLASREAADDLVIQVVDASARYERAALRFEQLGERVLRAAALERAIARSAGQRPASGSQGDPGDPGDPGAPLRRLRRGLEHGIETGLAGAERCQALGVWDPRLDAWYAQCVGQVAEWDRRFADILTRHHLMSSIAELLLDSHRTAGAEPAPDCDGCGCPQTRTRARPALGRHPDRLWVECAGCGVREVGRAGEGLIALRSLPRLRRDATVAVTVDVSALHAAVPAGVPPGFLVLEARDVTRTTPFVQLVAQHAGDVCRPSFRVPADLSPELHPLRVCWVRALEVTLARRRLPAFPSTNADRNDDRE
jgi:hypothetical protein